MAPRNKNVYPLPEAFLDLDEVAAPSPVANPREDEYYPRNSLENELASSESRRSSRRSSQGRRIDIGWPLRSVARRSSQSRRQSQRHSQLRYSDSGRLDSSLFQHEELDPPRHYKGPGRSFITEAEPNYRHETLERAQRRSRGHGEITELAIPPPVDRLAQFILEKWSNEPLSKANLRGERVSEFATELYTVCYLIFFSILGTLARLGLQALTVYPGAPVTQGVLWANFGGSVFMGFLAEDTKIFREEWGDTRLTASTRRMSIESRRKQHSSVKKTIPLYIGLATGFCGSFTSFSSWQRDAFLALSNSMPLGSPSPGMSTTPVARNGGYSFLALLATLIVSPALCIGALKIGAHLALALDSAIPTIPYTFARKVLDRAMVPVSILTWIGTIIFVVFPPDRPSGPSGHATWSQETWRGDVIFALVFAPVGCLLRFYVSLKLNWRIPSFPLGTFAVNMFGTLMEGVFYDLQHAPLSSTRGAIGGGRIDCQVLQGLMDGFCGCTTTISTWVAELNGLQRRHAYIYGAASAFLGLAIMVVVMGALLWTRGFEMTACGH